MNDNDTNKEEEINDKTSSDKTEKESKKFSKKQLLKSIISTILILTFIISIGTIISFIRWGRSFPFYGDEALVLNEGEYVIVDNQKIHLEIYGAYSSFELRPVIIFLHGGIVYSAIYDKFLDGLRNAEYNVIAFDRLGMGKSEGKRGIVEDNLLEQVSMVVDYANKHYPDAPIGIIGHNIGGQIAFASMIDDERIKSGIFQGIRYPTIYANNKESFSVWSLSLLSKWFPNKEIFIMTKNNIRAYFDFPETFEKIEDDPYLQFHYNFRSVSLLTNCKANNDFRKLKRPIMIVMGKSDKDPSALVVANKIYSELEYSHKLTIIEDVGNSLPIEYVDKFLPITIEWFDETLKNNNSEVDNDNL